MGGLGRVRSTGGYGRKGGSRHRAVVWVSVYRRGKEKVGCDELTTIRGGLSLVGGGVCQFANLSAFRLFDFPACREVGELAGWVVRWFTPG